MGDEQLPGRRALSDCSGGPLRAQYVELGSAFIVDSGDPLVLTFKHGATPMFLRVSPNLCPGDGWQAPAMQSTTYRLTVPDPNSAIPHAVWPG